jgi:hypothetical protein
VWGSGLACRLQFLARKEAKKSNMIVSLMHFQYFPMKSLFVRTTAALLMVSLVSTILSCGSAQSREGRFLVEEIEKFRKDHGRLPDSRDELDVTFEGEQFAFYEQKGPDWYIVWYREKSGKAMEYDSQSRRWREQR